VNSVPQFFDCKWLIFPIWPEATFVKPSSSLVKQVIAVEVQVFAHLSIQILFNGSVGRARKKKKKESTFRF